MNEFDPNELKNLFKPSDDSTGEDNGQIVVIGGSKLFHGALLYVLKVASRVVDMVFFATPEASVGKVAERMKSELLSFIWVPWEETEAYIEKSDAVLIGPGFMRFGSEKTPEADRGHENHTEGKLTREITKALLEKYPGKKWVIDAGSLQVMKPEWIPSGAIITPNQKEFKLLFKKNVQQTDDNKVQEMAKKYKCIIVLKGPETMVCSPEKCVMVKGGNPGLTKGGTGDVLAGLTVSLLAKNDPFLAAASASYIAKKAADELLKKVGTNYNADDLADRIPITFKELVDHP